MTEEEKLNLYLINERHIDFLKDVNSKFIYFGLNKDKKILVDSDEPKLPSIRCKIKKGYIELSVRSRKGGIERDRSLGRYMMNVGGIDILVDHINRNVLDNRRSNFRLVDNHVSAINKNRRNSKSKSKYKCVYKRKGKKTWILKVSKDNLVYILKLPSVYSEEDSAKIYDCLSLKINGDYNQTNFHKSIYSPQQIDDVYNDFIGFIKINKRVA